MKSRDYYLFSGIIFLLVFILHSFRVANNWELLVAGTWVVPMWLSWVVIAVTGSLAYFGFSLGGYLSHKKGKRR